MNLLMVCVLLLVALVCQPTLIYGLKGSHNSAAAPVTSNGGHDLSQRQRSIKMFGGKVKRSRSASLHDDSATELSGPKLVLALKSGDVLVKSPVAEGGADDSDAAAAVVGGGGKRNKNGNGNKKQQNKNSDASSNGGRKQDKKYSATIGSQTQQQDQQHHGHHGNGNGNGNGKGRQRQQLKSQQHQGHGKRGGIGNGAGAKMRTESGDNTVEKSQTSCRYSKSAWTECDPKTNMRTRTLTLKKGEESCLATRTMQKKCKKSCRYEKGAWSECVNGQMTRQDKLKSVATTTSTDVTIDSTCEPVRNINKKCNPGGTRMGNKSNKERKHKDKVQRRAQQA